MKKLYPLLSVLFLIYWGCEEEQEEVVDTTPPTVSISSHSSGQTVNEIITITVTTQDNEGISKVEFFIDDSLVLTDTESPYQYEWNTTQYEDNSEHIVKVISYDNSDNSTESQPIMLTVDNSTSTPNGGNITSVTYTLTEMTVEWEESSDGDFKDYKVLYSDTENGDRDNLETFTDKSTTSYTITEFDPLIENWFWVQVTDTLGLSSIGTGMTNQIDSHPTQVEINPIVYENNSFFISWSQNNDVDFQSYSLYESLSQDISGQNEIFNTENNTETSFTVTGVSGNEVWNEVRYYQIIVEDFWGLQSTSNIEIGDYYVELWGESYSVGSTTSLILDSDDLTGPIPPEIGNLINLSYLYLRYNQLTGSIPPEIGNLTNLSELRLYFNNLTGLIPPEIGNLTNLTELSLSSNEFTGSIPSEIGNLTNLTHLNLDRNQLTGSIPSEIWNMTNLEWLSLFGNHLLTGSIPPEIGNLTNLERLFLEEIQLTGEIPESICDLNLNWSNSSYFRIYNNQLCPPYPSCIEDYVGEQDTSGCD
jgi:Leucine-rich repeat (LRR) protein